VKHFRSDSSGEFYSKEFSVFCDDKGIVQEKTNPDTPQENSITEFQNQMLNNKACVMLAGTNLSPKFWTSAILHTNWITNHTPTKSLAVDKTPYEVYHNQKPSLLSLHEYGCKAWVQVPKKHCAKFEHKSIKCQYLGFAQRRKVFLLYDHAGGCIIQSHNVKFAESPDRECVLIGDNNDGHNDVVWVEDGDETATSGGDVDVEVENHSIMSPNEVDAVALEAVEDLPLRCSGHVRWPPTCNPDDVPKYIGSRIKLVICV
jgi:hypothetical protein